MAYAYQDSRERYERKTGRERLTINVHRDVRARFERMQSRQDFVSKEKLLIALMDNFEENQYR